MGKELEGASRVGLACLAGLSIAAIVTTQGACSCGSQATSTGSRTAPGHGSSAVDPPAVDPPAVDPATFASLVKPSGEELVRFGSEDELRRYAEDVERELRRQQQGRRSRGSSGAEPSATAADAPAEEAAGEAEADGDDDSITNNQEEGVDEGGIVKAHGDYLIVLRRGRLFSVRLGDASLTPVSMADAYPPGSRLGTWYDEMLIHERTIVVVGYSYVHGTGATELGLFDIDAAGLITHRATYFLRSNDYYSSRNYASRLVGDTLVFYMPYFLFRQQWRDGQVHLETSLPALTRWERGAASDDWNEIVQATDIYRPVQETLQPVLHTVVTCDLSSRAPDCSARGILGPFGRTFYVARDAVYVWTHQSAWERDRDNDEVAQAPAAVYRLPLEGGDPGVLRVWGAPTDQFSFKQGRDGYLNVLVRAEGSGDWMWAPEARAGDVALLRVPVAAFGTRVASVQPAAYTDLPRPEQGYVFQNRFVGDHVLYGTGSSWWAPEQQRDDRVFVHPYRTGGETKALELPHGVDRIEVMGASAVVVGTDGRSLHFSEVDLGAAPSLEGHYVRHGASQGELRSHGFFFRPTGEDQGVLGLPIRRSGSPGYSHLFSGSAEILYLHVEDHELTPLGTLESRDDGRVSDRCQMSCVDWYGNARPIFYRGRVFALLGYELVEGRLGDGAIHEVRRTNMVRRLLR